MDSERWLEMAEINRTKSFKVILKYCVCVLYIFSISVIWLILLTAILLISQRRRRGVPSRRPVTAAASHQQLTQLHEVEHVALVHLGQLLAELDGLLPHLSEKIKRTTTSNTQWRQ